MRMNSNHPLEGNTTYFLKDVMLFAGNLEEFVPEPDMKQYLSEQRWSMFYDLSIPVGTQLKVTPIDGSEQVTHVWTGISQYDGDSIYGLAKKYNSTVQSIINDNNLTQSVFNWSDICKKFVRKYQYNNIAARTAEQFFEYVNQVKDENILEYLQNLVLFASDYEIQNTDFTKQETWNKVDKEGLNLNINNQTPGNRLNIDNIIAGTSASEVDVNKDNPVEQHQYLDLSRTSPINTTQQNLERQMAVNEMLKDALNRFLESFRECFSMVINDYYESPDVRQGFPWLR